MSEARRVVGLKEIPTETEQRPRYARTQGILQICRPSKYRKRYAGRKTNKKNTFPFTQIDREILFVQHNIRFLTRKIFS